MISLNIFIYKHIIYKNTFIYIKYSKNTRKSLKKWCKPNSQAKHETVLKYVINKKCSKFMKKN